MCTHDLDYHFDYANDVRRQVAFQDFLIDIHGLDLARWEARVGFDPRFVSFSFFEDDRVVASVSIYSIDMLLDGAWKNVAQISSVGTRAEYRRRGLNAELTRRALEWARETGHVGSFLFSDEDAKGFYRKQGFVEVSEWIARLPARARPRTGARQLDFDRDEALIRRLVDSRSPVSHRVGVRSPRLDLFHLLYEDAGNMCYVEALDLLVCAEEKDGTLEVYDLIGPTLPPWAEIEPWLTRLRTRNVDLWLTPDLLQVEDFELVEHRSNCLHVRPTEELFTPPFMIPWTAHA